MFDENGVDVSQFTAQGRIDYARNCTEIAASRALKGSPYRNVFRLHCTDGCIDFTNTRSAWNSDEKVANYFGVKVSQVNGLNTGMDKKTLLAWLKSSGVVLYDVF